MQPELKYRLTKNWNWMRILRLLLAIGILVNGIVGNDFLLIAAGSFLLLQAVLNVGCASGYCAIDTKAVNKVVE